MDAPLVAECAELFVRRLRDARPDTPIVLVEDRTYANAEFLPAVRQNNDSRRAELRKAYDRLMADAIADLHYVPGETLLGDDGDATVDSSHPNDLGFMRLADALEPVLRPLI